MTLLNAYDMQALGIGVGLDTDDLQGIIDREAAELVRRYGDPTAAITEIVRPRGNSLYLSRAISVVTSISEQLYVGDPAPLTRDSGDYQVWAAEGRIERTPVTYGWGAVCTVVYTPVADTDLRNSVLTELVRISVEQASTGETVSGLGYSINGNAAGGGEAWHTARQAQYARLRGWRS